MSEILPSDYAAVLREFKAKTDARQVPIPFAASRELINLYRKIGQQIVERQENPGRGDAPLNQTEKDLKREMINLERLSRHNLYRMRQFYLACRTGENLCHRLWHKLREGILPMRYRMSYSKFRKIRRGFIWKT